MQSFWRGNRVFDRLIAIMAVALALGCGGDPGAGEGEPDAAGMLDGSVEAGADADMPDEMDAGTEDGGDSPDDAEVPNGDAGGDGSMHVPPKGSCSRWESDLDGDGEVDTAIAFFYDSDDRLVIEERDMGSAAGLFDGADGTPEYRQTITYDEEGVVASVADDWDADDNDDLITRYDVDGRKTEEVWDVADDGSVLDRTSYDYRDDGELAAKQRDSNGDGEADSATTNVYDDDGKLLRIEEDNDLSDELVDKVSSFEYDAEGRRTQEEVYEGEAPASLTTYTYDEDGNLTLREEDQGIDAALDAIEQWAFESGVLVSHELDNDGDGLVEERQTFDAEGRVLTDQGYHDGVLDSATTYEYDEDGNLVVERAMDGEATLLSLKQYAYGEGSRLTELTVDGDGDGIDDAVTRWGYDAEGHLLIVEERRSADPDAPFVVTEDYTYDAEGRLIETTLDSDADGTPDGFERRRYEC